MQEQIPDRAMGLRFNKTHVLWPDSIMSHKRLGRWRIRRRLGFADDDENIAARSSLPRMCPSRLDFVPATLAPGGSYYVYYVSVHVGDTWWNTGLPSSGYGMLQNAVNVPAHVATVGHWNGGLLSEDADGPVVMALLLRVMRGLRGQTGIG